MKNILWIVLALALLGLAFWFVVSPWYPKNSFILFLIAVYFGAPSIGAFWMIYIAIRHEKHPFPIIALALLPYTFIWYYFERYRKRKHITRESAM
jgi:hypothetical protein